MANVVGRLVTYYGSEQVNKYIEDKGAIFLTTERRGKAQIWKSIRLESTMCYWIVIGEISVDLWFLVERDIDISVHMYKHVCAHIFPSSVYQGGLEAKTCRIFSCCHVQALKNKPRHANNTQEEWGFVLQIQHFPLLITQPSLTRYNPNQFC